MMKSFLLITFYLISLSSFAFTQIDNETLKNDAIKQMNVGRYGEAIDLLNKYITANPRKAEGYNLRGVCYEKRNQFELAVYDFKNALKLAPNSKEYSENLNRITQVWYEQLYQKIEGHRREIAINPNKASNYLEIGKCYKNLGQWSLAEEWYDKYLEREEASADEIIRYSEILAKNNHIEKGEKILKTFTEKYPNDHRLWSRYGYFTLWLGKNKLAIEAFQKALEIRPYFLEAQDGLTQAMGKGYTYSVNDTSYRNRPDAKVTPQEYPIDRLYKVIKKKPDDDKSRFQLIKELKKAQRYEEAFEQLEVLSEKYSGTPDYDNLFSEITTIRDSVYQQNIRIIKERFDKNPSNENDLIKLTEYYNKMSMFDESMNEFSKFYSSNPDNKNNELRFRFAQTAAWNKSFNEAIEQSDILLQNEPDNLKYKLLSAQLSAWTELNLEQGRKNISDVLAKQPKNLAAIISAGIIEVHFKDFDKASEFLEQAKAINPNANDVNTLDLRITFEKLRFEEDQLFKILEQGRDLAEIGDCENALPFYSDFMSKTSPNRLIQKEYGDVLSCAKRYDEAIQVYSTLIDEDYDFNIDLERAKAYLWSGDSLKAISEFERLKEQEPNDFLLNLFLGDAYQATGQYKKARKTFDSLLLFPDIDSTQKSLVEQRLNWLPATGLASFLVKFPSYILVYPTFYYFEDNTKFIYQNLGAGLELGVLDFLSLAFYINQGIYRGSTTTSTTNSKYTSLYTAGYLHYSYFTAGATFGTKNFNTSNLKTRYNSIFVRAEKDSLFYAHASYTDTDAPEILYSKLLIGQNITAQLYQLSGFYIFKQNYKFLGNYKFITVKDAISNKGEVYDLRLGYNFTTDIWGGYEYAVTNFLKTSKDYFSPQNFSTHSVWAEFTGFSVENHSIVVGGKIGKIPDVDFIVSEIGITYIGKISERFQISASGRLGNTYREDTSYRSRSFNITATIGL